MNEPCVHIVSIFTSSCVMPAICAVVLALALSCGAILLKPSPMPLAIHRAENLAFGHGFRAQPAKALAFFNAILRDDAKSLDTYIKQADSCLQEMGRMSPAHRRRIALLVFLGSYNASAVTYLCARG